MALAANYSGGSVISYPLAEDGALGQVGSFVQHTGSSSGGRRQVAPHAHRFKISADGRFAFAYDQERGMLFERDSVPTLPADFDGIREYALTRVWAWGAERTG